jgi:hypothetical protein
MFGMTIGDGEYRKRKFRSLLFEVLLITVGVFLALWANNWNEDRQHRDRATDALRNFVGEMQDNRQAMRDGRQYHATLEQELREFLRSKEPPTEERFVKEVHFEGMRPIIFEQTAWDLALATQALSYIDSDLAFAISKVYTQQNAFQNLENSFLASAFTPSSMSADNPKGMVTAMLTYLVDANIQEPRILQKYDEVIPKAQRALEARSTSWTTGLRREKN